MNMTEKTILRELVNTEITALSSEYIAESDGGIYSGVLSLGEFQSARNILLYCSVKREPDTMKIAKYALAAGKTVSFPFCYKGGRMSALAVDDLDMLRPSLLGIPAPPESSDAVAPEELDLILVPALAYDNGGYRLGYGGGYYDRFLPGLKAYTVGLTRERLLRETLPREAHDIAVKCIVTEKMIRRLDTIHK